MLARFRKAIYSAEITCCLRCGRKPADAQASEGVNFQLEYSNFGNKAWAGSTDSQQLTRRSRGRLFRTGFSRLGDPSTGQGQVCAAPKALRHDPFNMTVSNQEEFGQNLSPMLEQDRGGYCEVGNLKGPSSRYRTQCKTACPLWANSGHC